MMQQQMIRLRMICFQMMRLQIIPSRIVRRSNHQFLHVIGYRREWAGVADRGEVGPWLQ
jgi:hypothetical protein